MPNTIIIADYKHSLRYGHLEYKSFDLAVSGTGYMEICSVPTRELWVVHGLSIDKTSGTCTFAGCYSQRGSEKFGMGATTAAQTTRAIGSPDQPLVEGDKVVLNIDGYTNPSVIHVLLLATVYDIATKG